MESVVVACVQQRMSIPASREEFETSARRFLRQAQAKSATLVLFPELAGVMLAAPLISGLKLGFIKRADQGKRPAAGILRRGVGSVSGAAASALGGGFRGSLSRLLQKNSAALRDLYVETFGGLAREFGAVLVGGSLYIYDEETESLRNRAYVFDTNGEVLGYQDKLNLAPGEEELATPGSDLLVFDTRLGRLGLLLGRDALYPELARAHALLGAELLVGIAASPNIAQASLIRQALALRAEENQFFAAISFLIGPNYLSQGQGEEYVGQSALLAPISLIPERPDGVLIQAGTGRSEGLIAASLDPGRLAALWESGDFRPRRQMHLGNIGPVLAEVYQNGLTIEQAVEQHIGGPAVPSIAEQEPADLSEVPQALEPAVQPVEAGAGEFVPLDDGVELEELAAGIQEPDRAETSEP